MKGQYSLGIDFGTTKSILSYIQRVTDTNIPPHFATFTSESHLTPKLIDTPYYRTAVQVQPVPTVIAIDKNSEDMATPRLIPGFKALYREQEGYEHFELVKNLKERLSKKFSDRVVKVNNYDYAIEGLVAHFLAALRKNAKELLKIPTDSHGITITIPAKADIVQRMTTQFAASVAGFKGRIELLEEPIAAFIYHRHLREDYFETSRNEPNYALVIDFGGGTCDLAVVQYQSGTLPRVIGRAMARFGGELIDYLFLKKFWLSTDNSESEDVEEPPLMSISDFKNLDASLQVFLLAHAREAKEYLSNNPYKSHAPDVYGAIPNEPGLKKTAPRVDYNSFVNMLENEPFSVFYADLREEKNLSLKKHLELLISLALKDADIEREKVAKIILAGGSIRLPNIREWTLEYLKKQQGEGKPNPGIEETDIHDRDAEVCIAGGAAIHQLYRHHKNKKWRKIIQPTLSSSFWLVYYSDGTNESKRNLGKQNDNLPLNCESYRKARVFFPKQWPDGKHKFVIRQGESSTSHIPELEVTYELPKDFIKNRFWNVLQAVLVKYYIDEFGILQRITLTPGSIFKGWNWRQPFKKIGVGINENQNFNIDLRELLLTNSFRIYHLRDQFIQKNLRL